MSARSEMPTPRRTGRRTGESGSRNAILAAAREQFAEKGYDGASLRSIASAAGVDTGLIRHFFGSKDDLFTATLEIPQHFVDGLLKALDGSIDGLGERLATSYIRLWEDPASARSLMAVVRSAIASDHAADRLRSLLGSQLLAGFPARLNDPDAELRAALAGAHLLGVAISRYVVRLPPMAEVDRDELIALVAPAVQNYLVGQLAR